MLVIGLGDLGSRVLQALAVRAEVDRLIGAGRNEEYSRQLTGQAALIADLTGGPRDVGFARVDIEDQERTARLLHKLRPDVVVMAASRLTWWRSPASDEGRSARLRTLPYGTWLPVQVSLVRSLMEAQSSASPGSRVVALPFPDAVGPALAPLGLAPALGAGNIAEVAAKLRVLAADMVEVDPGEIDVRLIMHHAAERQAFGAFSGLAGTTENQETPWLAQIAVEGRSLAPDVVRELFYRPYFLPPGTATHDLTAAATVNAVVALLGVEPRRIHAPAPHGLSGGYPLLVSRQEISLDLPPGIARDEAIAVNEAAARDDGIERIEDNGTIVFTDAVAGATGRILGLELKRVSPADIAATADELLGRAGR